LNYLGKIKIIGKLCFVCNEASNSIEFVFYVCFVVGVFCERSVVKNYLRRHRLCLGLWNENVKSQKGAAIWAANAKANGSNYTNVSYIGETGIIESGWTDNDVETKPYQLNADGTITAGEYGKPTTTKADPANAEPPSDGTDSGQSGGTPGGTGLQESLDTFTEFVVAPAVTTAELIVEKGTPKDWPVNKNAVKGLDILGKALGVYDAYNAWNEFADDPSAGKFVKAAVKTALVGVKSTVVGFISTVADLTGLTDAIFDWW
jgi:hypothetical protein